MNRYRNLFLPFKYECSCSAELRSRGLSWKIMITKPLVPYDAQHVYRVTRHLHMPHVQTMTFIRDIHCIVVSGTNIAYITPSGSWMSISQRADALRERERERETVCGWDVYVWVSMCLCGCPGVCGRGDRIPCNVTLSCTKALLLREFRSIFRSMLSLRAAGAFPGESLPAAAETNLKMSKWSLGKNNNQICGGILYPDGTTVLGTTIFISGPKNYKIIHS